MVQVSYSRDTYHTYMVVAGDADPDMEYEEKMLADQQSAILLPFHMQCFNGQKDYYYDITGMVDFRSCIEKHQADAGNLKTILHSLIGVCHVVDEYLLSLDAVLLDAEYIYMDIDMEHLYLAYIPGMKGNFTEGLQQLTVYLLENTNHKDGEGVLLVYNLYRMVRQEDFSPGILKDLLPVQSREINHSLEKKAEFKQQEDIDGAWHISETDDDTKHIVIEDKMEAPKGKGEHFCKAWLIPALGIILCMLVLMLYWNGYIQEVLDKADISFDARYAVLIIVAGILLLLLVIKVIGEKVQIRGGLRNPSEQDIWDDLESTVPEAKGVYAFTDMSAAETDKTIILSGAAGAVRLISLNKNVAEDLVVTKLPCILGSKLPDAEIIIAAAGISRKHAMFERVEGEIYLSDLGSTNGTYVNGEKLKKEEKRQLLVEDIIAFADIRYMFCGDGDIGL